MPVLVNRVNTCWGAFVYVALLDSILRVGTIKVTVPEGRLTAVRGRTTILGCEFTPEPGSDLANLVVTWQRQEDLHVVHSYYYQQDQLDRQSAEYHGRTSLFYSELSKGNASLRIIDVGPRDVGRYQCMVSTSSGTDKAEIQLDYGVFYTEPRLSISFSAKKVSVQYEAEGFPKPDVKWLGEQGQNLSHHTEVLEGVDGDIGLYHLKSSYEADTPALNITFVLRNELLHQDLQRPVSFSYADDSSNGVVITLALSCVVLIIIVLILSWLYWKKRT
ncbi:CD276 antigen [Pygocentrus nattereri]|uniref:Ig-like domain-containing protein n=1 Tax=Pygocentrus nattereri TaxID=42514 RepID=A0A3B4E2S1_PYGNA|nr:CD276 antigen [Pygocentrus nattereri]